MLIFNNIFIILDIFDFNIIFQLNFEDLNESQNDIADINVVDTSQDNISQMVDDELQEKESDDVPFVSSQPPKKKKKTNLVDEHLQEAFDILKRPYPTSTAPDEWSIYVEHVGNKLRGYPKQTAYIVQHLINNLLFEADMGKYDANPFQFVQPSQHFLYQNSPSTSFYQNSPSTSFSHNSPSTSFNQNSPSTSFSQNSHNSFASSTPSHTPVPLLSTHSEIPYNSVISASTPNNKNLQSSECMGFNVQENLDSTLV